MKKKFLICAPSFDANNGGAVVTHKLCAILNELGYEAYLTPEAAGTPAYRNNLLRVLFRVMRWKILHYFFPFRTHPQWPTPLIRRLPVHLDDSWIVIYTELVFGNPLHARNVVRWMLHRPGFHTGHIFYGRGELHVDFNEFAADYFCHGSSKARNKLYVLSFPFEHYNLDQALPAEARVGTAYCLRKGKGRPLVHDLTDSVLIDGLSHDKVAAIFKRVKSFISYDPYTAYSSFAVLCGAQSVVVPQAGLSKDQWFANEKERYGVAYGFDDLQWASETAGLVLGHMQQKEKEAVDSVRAFADEALAFFRTPT